MHGWPGVVTEGSSRRPPPAANPDEEARLLEQQCPGLAAADYSVTSGSTTAYNCVAWAVDDFEQCWSPTPSIPSGAGEVRAPIGGYYWPDDLPALMGIATLRELFRRRGFEECETTEHEDGFEKVAIFGDEIICQHVAVQRPDEPWTSKMGDNADIRHADASDIECGLVGHLQAVLRRNIQDGCESLPAPEPLKRKLDVVRFFNRKSMRSDGKP